MMALASIKGQPLVIPFLETMQITLYVPGSFFRLSGTYIWPLLATEWCIPIKLHNQRCKKVPSSH